MLVELSLSGDTDPKHSPDLKDWVKSEESPLFSGILLNSRSRFREMGWTMYGDCCDDVMRGEGECCIMCCWNVAVLTGEVDMGEPGINVKLELCYHKRRRLKIG